MAAVGWGEEPCGGSRVSAHTEVCPLLPTPAFLPLPAHAPTSPGTHCLRGPFIYPHGRLSEHRRKKLQGGLLASSGGFLGRLRLPPVHPLTNSCSSYKKSPTSAAPKSPSSPSFMLWVSPHPVCTVYT